MIKALPQVLESRTRINIEGFHLAKNLTVGQASELGDPANRPAAFPDHSQGYSDLRVPFLPFHRRSGPFRKNSTLPVIKRREASKQIGEAITDQSFTILQFHQPRPRDIPAS